MFTYRALCVCVYIYIYIYIYICLTKWLSDFARVLHMFFEVIKTVLKKLDSRPLKETSASVFWHASTTVLGMFSQTVPSDRRDFLSCAETSVKCISRWSTSEMPTCFGVGLMSAMDRVGSLQRNSGNALRMLQFQIETYFTTYTEFCDSVDWFLLTSKFRTRATVVWQGRWRTGLCSGPFNTTTSYFTGWLVQMLNSTQMEAVTAFVYLYYKITSHYKDYLKCWKVPHSRLWMGSFPYSVRYLVIVWKDIFWMVCHYMGWLISFRYSTKQPAEVLYETLS